MEKEVQLSGGTTVVMRAPKVRDIRAVSHIDDDAEREMTLLANLTGKSMDELDELLYADYRKLQEAYDFLASGGTSFSERSRD
jgi:hypothetical protein